MIARLRVGFLDCRAGYSREESACCKASSERKEVTVTEHKTESEPRKEDEEQKLEKDEIRDLDVEEQAEDVKGGGLDFGGGENR
jgi:hypothetical protein